jgi:endoglucanase
MTSRLATTAVCLLAVALGPAPTAAAQLPGQEPPPPQPPPSVPPPLAPPAPAPQPPPAPSSPDPRGIDPNSPNPLLGLSFYVDKKRHPAWRQYRWYRRKGKKWGESMMLKVASQPKFQWFGRWTRPARVAIRKHLKEAEEQQPGSVALVTVLRHQGRRCGNGYDGGGPKEDARTRAWYRGLANGIGTRRVVIAFEPDSLGTIDCLARHRRFARMKLLRYGVDVLSQLPNATIYLEGGASDWEPAARTAWQLRYIGIHKVRGFMLNVTHYDWTADNIRHGLELSGLTGGKPFIISTAFNGRGPVHYRKRVAGERRRINVWCHPLKRGLGPPPSTTTAHPKVDAYMWIGRPGYSGGSCNGGPLPVGTWWPERALMFAKYATDWLGPPAGTRNGHHKRYSLSHLGG